MNHRHAWKQGLAALALATLAAAASAQTTEPVLTLVATPSPGVVGSPVLVEVALTGIADLYAYQFSLAFDPTLLQAVSVAEGAFLPVAGSTYFSAGSINNTAGSINFTIGSLLGALPGVNGSGVLANIGFNVTQAGTSALVFSDVLLLDSNLLDLTVQVQNGSLVTTAVPEPGTWLMFGLGLAGVAGLARRRDAARTQA
ncbi:MAG: cohesin domain-containing protein [Rubrivivax sp.]|nr:cohesin domain-containing protein [Rubrivivax sp.]